ncbi:MAG: hypothetical protein ABIA77_06980 [Candidatus Omnitrophota bacterium]
MCRLNKGKYLNVLTMAVVCLFAINTSSREYPATSAKAYEHTLQIETLFSDIAGAGLTEGYDESQLRIEFRIIHEWLLSEKRKPFADINAAMDDMCLTDKLRERKRILCIRGPVAVKDGNGVIYVEFLDGPNKDKVLRIVSAASNLKAAEKNSRIYVDVHMEALREKAISSPAPGSKKNKDELKGSFKSGNIIFYADIVTDIEEIRRNLDRWFMGNEKRYFNRRQWDNCIEKNMETGYPDFLVKLESDKKELLGILYQHRDRCNIFANGDVSVQNTYIGDIGEVTARYRGRGLGEVLMAKAVEMALKELEDENYLVNPHGEQVFLELEDSAAIYIAHPAEDRAYAEKGRQAVDFIEKLGFIQIKDPEWKRLSDEEREEWLHLAIFKGDAERLVNMNKQRQLMGTPFQPEPEHEQMALFPILAPAFKQMSLFGDEDAGTDQFKTSPGRKPKRLSKKKKRGLSAPEQLKLPFTEETHIAEEAGEISDFYKDPEVSAARGTNLATAKRKEAVRAIESYTGHISRGINQEIEQNGNNEHYQRNIKKIISKSNICGISLMNIFIGYIAEMSGRAEADEKAPVIDMVIDLSLISSVETRDYIETWADLILMCRGFQNVNFIFEKDHAIAGSENVPDNIKYGMRSAPDPREFVDRLKTTVLGRAAYYNLDKEISGLIDNRIKINRSKPEDKPVEIYITSKELLEWMRDANIPLKNNQYPVAMEGLTTTGEGVALRNFEAALVIGLSKAALVLARDRVREGIPGAEEDFEDLKENILIKLNDLYKAIRKGVQITEYVLMKMIDHDELAHRLERAIDLYLPPITRMPVKKLQHLHESIRQALQSV